ncbi:MAG: 30S ribosomal protein S20 [Chloroflexi bacterium]|nr:MAG: 30S ribosomal protein S20 [Chloroflexota bacterium]
MANIKSAIKRARQNLKRREYNRYYRKTARTYVKKARKLIEANELEAAQEVIQQAYKALDKAAQKGVIKRNNAARRKSRLMRAFNKAKAAASQAAE